MVYLSLCRQGSVISSFNVSYPGVDGLQIVALQEEIAGGSLGNTPADLLSITTKNGKFGKRFIAEVKKINFSTKFSMNITHLSESLMVINVPSKLTFFKRSFSG